MSYRILNISTTTIFSSDGLPTVRPGCARCMASFLHSKGNYIQFMGSMNIYPLHHGVFFYPYCLAFYLQIGIDKLVGKVPINLLYHAKSATGVISIQAPISNCSFIDCCFMKSFEKSMLLKDYSIALFIVYVRVKDLSY